MRKLFLPPAPNTRPPGSLYTYNRSMSMFVFKEASTMGLINLSIKYIPVYGAMTLKVAGINVFAVNKRLKAENVFTFVKPNNH